MLVIVTQKSLKKNRMYFFEDVFYQLCTTKYAEHVFVTIMMVSTFTHLLRSGINYKFAILLSKMVAILSFTMETGGVTKKSNTFFTQLDPLNTMVI